MSPQHEIDRLNWNVAGLEVESALARICVPPPKPEPKRVPLIDRPWVIVSMCVVVIGVLAFSAWSKA